MYDGHFEDSIKPETRQKRCETHMATRIHVQYDLRVPKDGKGFMSKGESKESLVNFYTEFITSSDHMYGQS